MNGRSLVTIAFESGVDWQLREVPFLCRGGVVILGVEVAWSGVGRERVYETIDR